MNRSLFRNAIRNLIKNKSFTLINVTGLSIGVTVFFMLFVYVVYENSYDEFLNNSENTYRVELDVFRNGKLLSENATATYSIGPLLEEHIPQVKKYARAGFEKCLIYRDRQSFNGQELFWVDSTFLSTVDVKMLCGDKKTALIAPYTAVLSEDMAKKFFGDEDPMDQTIFVNEHLRFTVKGVYETLPQNSHFNFRLLLSLSTGNVLWPGWGTNNRSWGGQTWLYTYVNLEKNADIADVEKRMNAKVKELLPEQLVADNYQYNFHLKPIQDIHLTSHRDKEFKVNGSEQSVNLLFFIALLIIVTVWINYINIASSEAFEKAKEVGIRKVNGSSKIDIIKHFMIEVFVLNIFSLFLTFMLIGITASIFESIFDVPVIAFLQNHFYLYLYLIAIVLVGTFISGIYPAVVMASFEPNKVLKGTILSGRNKFAMRKSLLVFQLVVTITLIVSAITIHKQIKFMHSADLGFTKDLVLSMPAPCTMNMDSTKHRRFLYFKDRLLTLPAVKVVTSSQNEMGTECLSTVTYNQLNGKEITGVRCYANNIDDCYLETYDIKLLAGRNFKFAQTREAMNGRVLINQSTVKQLGFTSAQQAIGNSISVSGEGRVEIIGVINDFNQESLKTSIKPMVFFHNHPSQFGSYSVKMGHEKISATIDFIKEEWRQNYPNAPFVYEFVDDKLGQIYKAEERFGNLLVLFTTLAIVIACLGLLGLVIILNRKRIKEIGVRKVNGARISEILVMLNKDFVRWVVVAFLIACPIAWYGMNEWLSNFAYKTVLSWWIFAVSGLLALFIALLTITIQSYKAANYNPVEALRYE
ncbi:ABC transporter permease [Prolixibacteraceae bacterium JC049]|nr:ABC transporter permease [Prolixibacteraceae bacterium JC049]